MEAVTKLNKRLKKAFGGKVCAMLNNKVLYLTGELYNWDDIVRAGMMAVNKKQYTVVNDIEFKGLPDHLSSRWSDHTPLISSNKFEGESPDVLIIGGGIIGCSIARELTRYKLNVMLAEKEHDVALHASGRNNGIINPGINLKEGQLRKKYNKAGSQMYPKVCSELDVPFKYTGQYIYYTNNWLKPAKIASVLFRSKRNDFPVEYVSRKELLKKEPLLNKNIKFALFFPAAGSVCPHELTIAYAENASDNGAKICLDTAVINICVKNEKIKSVLTNHGRIFPKLVINASGVFSEEIARLANDRFFSIHPRRIMQMIEYNLYRNPNTIETFERENFSAYAGVRADTYEEDFIVSFGKFTKNIIHAAGIQSPGLTAAPAIAADISRMAAAYLDAVVNENFNPIRLAIVRAADLPEKQRDALIKKNSEYGEIVCRCEEISRGEVLASLRRSIPCDTLDGVKRRVRPGLGRCQGSFCGPQIAQIIAEERNVPITKIKKMSDNSELLFGESRKMLFSESLGTLYNGTIYNEILSDNYKSGCSFCLKECI
ncbi:MAG: FAD-dependent oxidoreductase [Treponema sp.]|nr:FAD-dependent oxidoreductase [Treponema sp.]